MQNVIVTGADRGLGLSLCREYLERGWRVFAGKFMEDYFLLENLQKKYPNLHILRINMSSAESILAAAQDVAKETSGVDMLISNAALMEKVDFSIGQSPDKSPMDLESVWRSFNINALGPLRLVETFLPLMSGGMKRLCFVSSEVSCINLMKNRWPDAYSYPYPMSKAAMNMAIRLMHNELVPKGFSFRLYHPGWMKFREPDGTLTEEGKFDPDDIAKKAAKYFEAPQHNENRLAMLDFCGYEWPF